QLQIHIRPEPSLVHGSASFCAKFSGRLKGKNRQRPTIGHGPLGAKQAELMFLVNTGAKRIDQYGVIDRESFSAWCFDIEHEILRVGVKGSCPRVLRFGQINGTRRFVRTTKPRLVSYHLPLLPAGEIRKPLWTGRARERKEAVAVNSRVAGEHLIQ